MQDAVGGLTPCLALTGWYFVIIFGLVIKYLHI